MGDQEQQKQQGESEAVVEVAKESSSSEVEAVEKVTDENENQQQVETTTSENGVKESSPSPSHVVAEQAAQPVQQQQSPPQQHQVPSGPRPAPVYKVVNSVIEKRDDGPGPRCGHTLTAVAAVNEEGSPGYIGPRLILFGGATALEGNSAAGPQAASPGAGIRMFLPT